MDLELHRREQGPVYDDRQLTVLAQLGGDIFADRSPQAQELHIVVFDEADGAQIIQLILSESQGAQMVDLGVDFIEHLLRECNALVAAFKVVFTAQIGVLMENNLIHIEFIQIGVQ